MSKQVTVEIRPMDNKWITTIENPGSTFRLSKSFESEDEAIRYGNTVLDEYRKTRVYERATTLHNATT